MFRPEAKAPNAAQGSLGIKVTKTTTPPVITCPCARTYSTKTIGHLLPCSAAVRTPIFRYSGVPRLEIEAWYRPKAPLLTSLTSLFSYTVLVLPPRAVYLFSVGGYSRLGPFQLYYPLRVPSLESGYPSVSAPTYAQLPTVCVHVYPEVAPRMCPDDRKTHAHQRIKRTVQVEVLARVGTSYSCVLGTRYEIR